MLLPLRERYELTLTDVRNTEGDGTEVEGIILADLTIPDRRLPASVPGAGCCGVAMGLCPAGRAHPGEDFPGWVCQCRHGPTVFTRQHSEENVARVVVASSNHAADYYEALILDGKMDFVDPNGRALSDNYYGWAKEVYEHLGFVFACGVENGRALENVQIRIGGPRETDIERCELGDLRCMRRALGAYISERDMQQLFVKSIEAEDIRDENGVPFQIFYGVSGNHHNFWSIANARKVIGYAPEDNSELRFASWIQKHIAAATAQS
ncbi:MAG: NAD(P)-dependent oxidoreductase [Ardenticatenales bacterium]|nr:NAD(P)-dependent oxidoreductase [Ardenticatenales bacterium]